MYEQRSQPLLPRREFLGRMARSTLVGLAVVAVSLLIGMIGFHGLEKLDWLQSFLNASMLLGGMGPVDVPRTAAGKLFSGLYALYCGFAVLAIAGFVFAPLFHRFLHRFHLEGSAAGKIKEGAKPRARRP
jgi:hypothetical protein